MRMKEVGVFFMVICISFNGLVREDGRGCAYCIFTWVLGITVNSLYCGHPWDRELVPLIVRVRNYKNLFQSNVCNLFLPGI